MNKRLRIALLSLVGVLPAACAAGPGPAPAAAAALATAPVQAAGGPALQGFDAVVEAVRSSVVAPQVAGAIVALEVQPGDRVKAGQVLARIDARSAEHGASASDAQVRSAQAQLDVAAQDFQRQRQLHERQYISPAALERAEAQFKATQAQVAAQLAQARAARTQSSLHVLRAPFAGVVAAVPVALGDMALPGKPLLSLYEPGALRVSAALPQSLLGAPLDGLKIEFPSLPEPQRWFAPAPAALQLLPTLDAATHTRELRVVLPADARALAPGLFARVWLPVADAGAGTGAGATPAPRVFVPASAVVRRAELTAVYVVDAKGLPQLRQVRLGRARGSDVEVLSGLSAGQRVALDPQAAARVD
jgi:membrane fusion protein, multidrug efflux system